MCLIRLVFVVGYFYLNLDHVMLVFSLSIISTPTVAYKHISISHVSFLSSSQHHISDLTILEFILWTTNLRKQLYKNLKYGT
jgi:hypothetical protein